MVLDVSCRPRMGAWIEIESGWAAHPGQPVAPVWGRGLKSWLRTRQVVQDVSPPYGGVD